MWYIVKLKCEQNKYLQSQVFISESTHVARGP